MGLFDNDTSLGPQGGGGDATTIPTAPVNPFLAEKPPSPLTHAYQNGSPIGRSLGLGTRDVIEGALSLPMTALDLGTYLGRGPIRAMGGSATAPSDMLHNALTYIGLPEATTPGEKFRSEVARGGAGMIGPQIAGAIPRVAAAVPTVLRSAFAPAPLHFRSPPLRSPPEASAGARARSRRRQRRTGRSRRRDWRVISSAREALAPFPTWEASC
jgi:hypothetical protein